MAHVTRERLAEVVCGLVDVPSPTGGEAAAATWLAEHLAGEGVTARVQALDDLQANAVGTLTGGDGPSILLYAPLDTFTTGDPAHDVPWAAPELPPAAGLRSPARPKLCAAGAEAAAVFDEAAIWGHIGAGKIHSGRAPRRTKIKGGHER